jgi:flagellar hook-basal body complex protein FliE
VYVEDTVLVIARDKVVGECSMTTEKVIIRLRSRLIPVHEPKNDSERMEWAAAKSFNDDLQAAIDKLEQLEEKVSDLDFAIEAWRDQTGD